MYFEQANLTKVLEQFDRTEASFNEDVDNIENWLKTQLHLPEVMGKQKIRAFLLMHKCKIEITKNKIDMYYTIRSIYPEYTLHHPFEYMDDVCKAMYSVILPKLTQDQYRMFVLKVRDPVLIDVIDPLNVALFLMDMSEIRLIQDIIFQDVVICDMNNVTMNYCSKFIPHLSKFGAFIKSTFKFSAKKVYVLNPKPFLPTILNIAKTLFSPKLFHRIHILKDERELLDIFPKEILPKDFGGNEKSLDEITELWKDIIRSNREVYEDRLNKKVNEDLRVELIDDGRLGIYGNFKKLNVD